MLIIVIIILAVILLALLVRPVCKPAAGGKDRDRSAAGDAGIAPPSSTSDFAPGGGDFAPGGGDFGGAGNSGNWDAGGDGGGGSSD